MKDESGLRTGGGSTVNGAAVQGWVKVSTHRCGHRCPAQSWCLKGNNAGVCFSGNNGFSRATMAARLYFSALVKYGDVTDSGGEEEAINKHR